MKMLCVVGAKRRRTLKRGGNVIRGVRALHTTIDALRVEEERKRERGRGRGRGYQFAFYDDRFGQKSGPVLFGTT